MKSSEVFEVTLATKSVSLILEGHATGALRGLDCNPNNPKEYATIGIYIYI